MNIREPEFYDPELAHCLEPTGLARRPPGSLLTMLSRDPQPACGPGRRLRRCAPLQDRGGSSPRADDRSLGRPRHRGAVLGRERFARRANALEKIEKSTGVPVLIETIETLKGETIDEVATRLARRSGTQGVFILIARKETKIEVLASRRYAEALPARRASRSARPSSRRFRKKNFDEGLREGIAALDTELASAKRAKASCPWPRSPRAGTSPPARALSSAVAGGLRTSSRDTRER